MAVEHTGEDTCSAYARAMDADLEAAMNQLEYSITCDMQLEAELAELDGLRHLYRAVLNRRRANDSRQKECERQRRAIASRRPHARRARGRTSSSRHGQN